jgi:hypothetical protein
MLQASASFFNGEMLKRHTEFGTVLIDSLESFEL